MSYVKTNQCNEFNALWQINYHEKQDPCNSLWSAKELKTFSFAQRAAKIGSLRH